jgi:citrate synthase
MDALRMAAGTLSLVSAEATGIVARVPTIVASYWRLRNRQEPLAPRRDLGHAANFLYMLTGDVPDPERVRGLETYLNTVVDHGFNASTFTARVITSTGSDLVSAVVGALGALKGPRHGGAPGPALDMVFEIGDASRAERVLRKKIEAGEKLMGFGHRIYKVRDPRADVLAKAAERMFTRAGDMSLYALARSVEAEALRLLALHKPGRRLQTNVEFYTALLLHGLGLDVALFTPTFAVSRVSGWIAHAFEQRRANRIIRPQSEYVGPRDRRWVPASQRSESVMEQVSGMR